MLCDDCLHQPVWCVGDGEDIASVHYPATLAALRLPKDLQASMLLTCPPYYDLERYGDSTVDLSEMPYDTFTAKYKRILANATSLLKPMHVAVVVIGNVRDPKGELRDLHSLTKQALTDAGCPLYVDAVLKTALASAPARAGRQMAAGSKLVGVHQNVVVACKDKVLTPADCRLLRIRAAE